MQFLTASPPILHPMLQVRLAARSTAILLCVGVLAATSAQDQQPPQPFRSGTTTSG